MPLKCKTYADRPMTPLGEATGITSTPVSEAPSRGDSPRPDPAPNPYHYQPAITSQRPELAALRCNSSNYANARAESFLRNTAQQGGPYSSGPPRPGKDGSPPRGPGRSYSFSAEDLKRSSYQHLMTAELDERKCESGRSPLMSPGIGNSEAKGREYGFSSTS
jgi:hypothetical protein